jgi:hypothetical protein
VGKAAPTRREAQRRRRSAPGALRAQSGRDLPCRADPAVWHYKGAGQGGSVRLALAVQCGRGLGWMVQRLARSAPAAAGC